MSTIPLSELIFDTDQPPEFDPFTPHIRVLSLGGVSVTEGGWTAGELLKEMRCVASTESIEVASTGGLAQISAQLNAFRITWLSSLLSLVEAKVGVLLIDARLGEDWISSSVDRAIRELTLWRRAHLSVREEASLSVLVWIELPSGTTQSPSTLQRVSQALERMKRVLVTKRIHLMETAQGSALSEQSDAARLWNTLTHHVKIRSEDTTLWSEQRCYIDSFAPIAPGQYYQGGGRLSSSVERPQHRVKISRDLWVSQTPISQAFWSMIMDSPIGEHEERSAHAPIANISWFESLRFCNRLSELEGLERSYEIEDHTLPKVTWRCEASGYRLLTESEWEYACRGGATNSPTATAPLLPPAWTSNRAQLSTHPVAELLPNGWGLYDCLGNVAEWCQDTFVQDAYQRRAGQRLSVDPCEYDMTAGERVIRGGAFDTEPYLATPSRRDSCPPQRAWSTIGFRVVRPR